MFQHTAARRRLVYRELRRVHVDAVSTHSRPKAAGCCRWRSGCCCYRFNTQPPEGGWVCQCPIANGNTGFNTQPPEGGWFLGLSTGLSTCEVSTHSRPKAAGKKILSKNNDYLVSTHSRPKAAGKKILSKNNDYLVSTHSRPKAAGGSDREAFWPFNSFQHTAARRRLVYA